MRQQHINKSKDHLIDSVIGNRLIQIKSGVTSARDIRAGIAELAYALEEQPGYKGYFVLLNSSMTYNRVYHEWQLAASVLRSDISNRLNICLIEGQDFIGIPRELDNELRNIISKSIEEDKKHLDLWRGRTDASFIVFKLFLYHWFIIGDTVGVGWLMEKSGYSYPTVANLLEKWGSIIERWPNKKVSFRWFPKEEFARTLLKAERARSTKRFQDKSGQPRTVESLLNRLKNHNRRDLAIGGVFGAKYYFPMLNIVGSPRLDISLHCPQKHVDLSFIEKIDPALMQVSDPLEPASVVVHIMRQTESFFKQNENGLQLADPVECLFDLYEAHLEMQASQFLEALKDHQINRA